MSKLSIKILGTLIIVIFITVLSIIIITNKNYLSTNSVISNNPNIISLGIEDNKLKIVFDDKVSEYCIKTTKTKPSINNICFKKVTNNIAYASIYKYKKYYIWTKDINGNISDYISYDA